MITINLDRVDVSAICVGGRGGPAVVAVVAVPARVSSAEALDALRHDQAPPASGVDLIRASVEAAAPPAFANLISSADFDDRFFALDYLIDGVLVAGQPCIGGGRSKTLKTSIVGIDMAISLGTGTPFLGHFSCRPSRVAFWSGEAGAATIQAKARTIAEARGRRLADCNVLWSFDLPRLGNADHVSLMKSIIENNRLRVLIVDPLYLSLLDTETAGLVGNVFAMGSILAPLSELCHTTGATIVLLHHFRKGYGNDTGDELSLESLSQAGVAEWARQWLLLARREPYRDDGRHALWLQTGGIAGHSGRFGLDIDEGTVAERKWSVAVSPAAAIVRETRDAKAKQANEKKREQEIADEKAVIRAFADRIDRREIRTDEGVFRRKLRAWTGLSDTRIDRAVESLIEQDILEACEALASPRHHATKPGALRLHADWMKDQKPAKTTSVPPTADNQNSAPCLF